MAEPHTIKDFLGDRNEEGLRGDLKFDLDVGNARGGGVDLHQHGSCALRLGRVVDVAVGAEVGVEDDVEGAVATLDGAVRQLEARLVRGRLAEGLAILNEFQSKSTATVRMGGGRRGGQKACHHQGKRDGPMRVVGKPRMVHALAVLLHELGTRADQVHSFRIDLRLGELLLALGNLLRELSGEVGHQDRAETPPDVRDRILLFLKVGLGLIFDRVAKYVV